MGRRGRQRANGGLATALLWIILFAGSFAPAVAAEPMDANLPRAVTETLAAVRDGMARNPAPWPDEWQNEYVDAIRAAIAKGQETPEFNRRLQILRDGFGPWWKGLPKNAERAPFEVRRAQIRWYVENLMSAQLPDDETRQTLRRQYESLADHAAQSLLAQFSFLDPNRVQEAKADHLAECYRNIDATLLPISLTPLSEAQMDQIEQRWHDMRYARVDLWRSLGGHEVVETQDPAPPGDARARASTEHPDYLLTRRSLDQLRGQVWSLPSAPPDYYRDAVASEIAAGRQRLQGEADARRQERRLGVAVWQTEYLSFLLTALLEMAESLPEKGE